MKANKFDQEAKYQRKMWRNCKMFINSLKMNVKIND